VALSPFDGSRAADRGPREKYFGTSPICVPINIGCCCRRRRGRSSESYTREEEEEEEKEEEEEELI
jgi:hypothetical protein